MNAQPSLPGLTQHLRRILPTAVGSTLAVLGAAVLASPAVREGILTVLAYMRRSPTPPDWPRNLAATGGEALVLGFLVAIVAYLTTVRGIQARRLLASDRALVAGAAALLLITWMPIVLFGRSASIAGKRTWWLVDDAAISLVYARNAARGLGLVWNPGQAVEGYTNFLWTVYLTILHLLPFSSEHMALPVLLTNVALGLATLFPLLGIVRMLRGGTLAQVFTLAGFVLSRGTLVFAASGMETTLLTLVLVWSLYRILLEAEAARPTMLTYVLVASAALVRGDGIVLSMLLYALALWINRPLQKRICLFIALSLLLPGAHLLFRLITYHDLMPNTAYLKTMYWDGRYKAGIAYVARYLSRHALLITAAVLGAVKRQYRVRTALIVGLIGYTAYVAYIGGDMFGDFRYFVPVLPIWLALAFLSAEGLRLPALRGSGPIAVAWIIVLSIPLISPGYAVMVLYPWRGDPGNVEIGMFLRDHTPLTSRVASVSAGNLFYFGERQGVDLLGKADPYIAHLPVTSDGMQPGHNKFDFDYSLGKLQPDFVVAPWKLPVDEEEMRRMSSGDFAFAGRLYFHPLFQEHCLPHPLPWDTWRTVFACDWRSPAGDGVTGAEGAR